MGYSIFWVVARRKSVQLFFAVPMLLALMFSTFAFLPAFADMGPKPTMEFRVKYSIPVVQVKSGQLMQSDKSDMSRSSKLRRTIFFLQSGCLLVVIARGYSSRFRQ